MKNALDYLVAVSLLCILIAGCVNPVEDGSQVPCKGQDPIVGAWRYDPAGRGDAVFLYLFKDYHRYDAIATPRNETTDLTYELWATGSWANATNSSYDLAGQIYLHDFITDDLIVGPNNETLAYDPARDVLYNRNHPEALFTRLSCVPKVPAWMNVSIPFD